MTETDFQSRIIDLAHLRGWHVVHYRAAFQGGRWITPMQGDPGCPDLILARGGRVILAELKTDNGKTTPQQDAWLAALGEYGRLWRPTDWPEIMQTLNQRAV